MTDIHQAIIEGLKEELRRPAHVIILETITLPRAIDLTVPTINSNVQITLCKITLKPEHLVFKHIWYDLPEQRLDYADPLLVDKIQDLLDAIPWPNVNETENHEP